jgi:hypothetical protein
VTSGLVVGAARLFSLRMLTIVALGALVAGVGASATRAQSEPASQRISGTWTITSEPGDTIGEGVSHSFAPETISLFSTQGLVSVESTSYGHWSVRLAAPGGARLEERAYPGASRVPAATEPRLDVGGDARGCNLSYGSFTVHDVEYGLRDQLTRLHVTFEHACGPLDTTPGLSGEVDIVSEAPPAPLAIEVLLGDLALADGQVEVSGSIECSQDVTATMIVEVADSTRPDDPIADSNDGLSCSPTSTDWQIPVATDDGSPIAGGSFEVKVTAEAIDERSTAAAGAPVYAVSEVSAALDDTSPVASPGHIARDPALALLLWLVCLIGAVLATVLVTLLVIRRRVGPGPSEPT